MRTMRRCTQLAIVWGVAVGACRVASHAIAFTPSLAPVDTARPMVLYEHVRGSACGDNSVQRALQDLRRVRADGFVEVVVEETGDGAERCTTITARPFTYCQRVALAINPDPTHGAGVTEIPSREEACRARPVSDCDAQCARFAEVAHADATQTEVHREACRGRCGDEAFMTCARAATTPDAVRRCRELPDHP